MAASKNENELETGSEKTKSKTKGHGNSKTKGRKSDSFTSSIQVKEFDPYNPSFPSNALRWGGEAFGYPVINTCPVDSTLMAFYLIDRTTVNLRMLLRPHC